MVAVIGPFLLVEGSAYINDRLSETQKSYFVQGCALDASPSVAGPPRTIAPRDERRRRSPATGGT
jgi:hypothetical protein